MKRFPLIIAVMTVLVILLGIFLFSRKPSGESVASPLPSNYEYFWGEGCPHCANVAEFLNSWENANRVEIEKKEVYENQENAKLLLTRAQSCNLPNNQVGVPFLFTPEGKCLVGDSPIISFFKQLEFEN
ncbi:MAG: hypothetical protein P8Y06_01815 [Patescibacteria group bacterium]